MTDSNTPPSSPDDEAGLSGLGRELLGGDSSGQQSGRKSTPSGPWQPPSPEELQKLLPQYEVLSLLGRGGMGAVYQGRQISLDRLVAIKILSGELDDADQGFAERFKNEARAMAKLSHPGIVSVFDFGETPGGLLYIVMEFIEGTDVQQMISGKRRLHTEHAMAITAHVCDALAYAHERGIIHRDIKPSNIMVGYDGSVKVADFGLAKINQGGQTLGLTQSGMAMGTLHYMAPETLTLGTAVDHRADIYAVGVMLYQMLTGKLPQGMFEMPSMQVPGLDPRYDGIIAKALREDRDLRYGSAAELRRDLDAILTRPVVKAEAGAGKAVAALPTQARPQRPGAGRPQQPYRPPPAQSRPQVIVRKEKKSSPLLWVALLAISAVAGWLYFERGKAKAAQASQPASVAGVPPGTPAAVPAVLQPSITIHSPDAVRILPLSVGQPRLYDSNPLRVIEKIDPSLAGWQFTSTPQRIDNTYEIRVTQPGVLYAFGGLKKDGSRETVFGADASQWEPADGAIEGEMILMCFKRRVTAGETLRFKAFELQFAAANITLEQQPVAAKSAPSSLSSTGIILDDAFMRENVLGTSWRARYTNDPRHDTLEFMSTGNEVVKTASTGNQQQARWSIEDGGQTLKVTTLDGSGFYFVIGFSSPTTASVEFSKVPPAKMVGTLTKLEEKNTAPEDTTGWQPLFPGDSLAGWKGDSSQFQIKDGILSSGAGKDGLFHLKEYGDFILKFDLRLAAGAHAEIGIREQNPPQPSRGAPNASFGVVMHDDTDPSSAGWEPWRKHGAVYGYQAPLKPVMGPVGTWHEHEIRVENQHLTVTIDGIIVQDTPLSSLVRKAPGGRSLDLSRTHGQLVIWGFKNAAEFRNMRIKELPANPSIADESSRPSLPPSPSPTPEDWQPLFPNDSLTGWTGDTAGYRLANGILTSTEEGGDLISPKEYGSFHLKFDLRLCPGGNNGIGIWCADNKQGYKFLLHTGFEIQLIDDASPTYTKAKPWQSHGALTYFLAPQAKPMQPAGSWNAHEIRMEGTRLTVIINNVTVIDQELPTGDPVAKGSRRHRLDLSKKRGHVVFSGMKGPVDFRNLMIRDLDGVTASVSPTTPPEPPLPRTDPPTWIDVQGRSIQAKFVRIEGDNVLLDIAGKVTPVALGTFSAASQQQARELQAAAGSATSIPSVPDWLMGLWYQFNDGKPVPFHPLAFFSDYSAGFGWPGKGLGRDGRWNLQGNKLVVTWPNHCVYEIDLKGGKAKTTFEGIGTGADQKTFAIKMVHTGMSPADLASIPKDEDLAGLTFDFLYHGPRPSDPKGSNGLIRLAAGGVVEMNAKFGITNWEISNGFLHLTDARRHTMSLFNDFKKAGGKWKITGLYIPIADCVHTLKQE